MSLSPVNAQISWFCIGVLIQVLVNDIHKNKRLLYGEQRWNLLYHVSRSW